MSKYKIRVADFLMFVLITISFFFISESIAGEHCLSKNDVEQLISAQPEIRALIGSAKFINNCS